MANQADINNKKDFKIRDVYNPSDEERETIAFVYDRKRSMEDAEMRQKAQRTWNQSDEQWEAMRKVRGKDDWQSNHYVPLTQAAIETAIAEVIGQIPRPYIEARGTEDVPKVAVMQKIDDYCWEVADGDSNMYDVTKSSFTRGTAVAQEYYWQERRIIQEMDMKNGKPVFTEKEAIDYDDCYMENVKLEDFFVDEFARGFSGPYAARDCIRRYVMNIDDFKVMFSGEIWDQFGNVKADYVRPGGDTNYYEWYKPPTGMDMSKQVEVLWYWAVKPKDWLIIVANDVLIRKVPIPYRHKKLPFVRSVAIKRTDSFYGKGLSEVLESIQDETNTLRRMIIDRNHLDIDKMFFVSNRLGLSDEDLIARPHGLIPTDDVNQAKAVEYNDIPRSVELSLKHLEDDATISTGINPRAQALPQAGTATEAAILKESTLKRLQLMIWLLKTEFLIPLERLRISNIIQFYSQPKLEEIVGASGTQEFQAEVSKLQEQGLVVAGNDGKMYKKSFRNIRLENQQIQMDEKGKPSVVPASGTTFFEARPQYFVPVCKGGYDVKFRAGSNLQLSKPLQQTKDLELFDRLFRVAQIVPNSYDPVKLGDMVVRSYDKDPNSLKPDQQQLGVADARVKQLIQLAVMENKQMSNGTAVPPTPYSNVAHTQIHLEYMNSEAFQSLPNDSPNIQIFTNHVVGEIAAQEGRKMGGEEAQSNEQTNATSSAQGIENRPGGVAKPTDKMSDVMPGLNTGSNSEA